jgi:hypothetical protein
MHVDPLYNNNILKELIERPERGRGEGKAGYHRWLAGHI